MQVCINFCHTDLPAGKIFLQEKDWVAHTPKFTIKIFLSRFPRSTNVVSDIKEAYHIGLQNQTNARIPIQIGNSDVFHSQSS